MTINKQQPVVSLIVIGDEILTGRTKDVNIHQVAQFCQGQGLHLLEVRIVADNVDAIVDAVRALRAVSDHVITTGGIGPTLDDMTVVAVAQALDRNVEINARADAMLTEYYASMNKPYTEQRRLMARTPSDARLIMNAVSVAPGFFCDGVWVLAGVPKIVAAMLDSMATMIAGGDKQIQIMVRCVAIGESELVDMMKIWQETHTQVKIGSYPAFTPDGVTTSLVFSGFSAQVVDACVENAVKDITQQFGKTPSVQALA